MRRYSLYCLAILACLLFSVALAQSGAMAAPTSAEPITLFTVPVGPEGVTYEHLGVPESEPEGPAALAVAPDGTFWIADTPTSRLLHYSAKGEPLGTLDLGEKAAAITDLVVTERAIFALDIAAPTPALFHLSPDGKAIARHELPAGWQVADGLTGISGGEGGTLLLERHFGAEVAGFIGADGKAALQPQAGYQWQGQSYAVQPPDLNDPAATVTRATLTVAGRSLPVTTPNLLGGIRLLGIGSQGEAFAQVEEVFIDSQGQIQVDQTVRRYDPAGTLKGLARVPIADQQIYAEQGVALGPKGEIFALVTHPDHVAIQRLPLVESLPPVLATMTIEGNPFAAPEAMRPTTDDPTTLGTMEEATASAQACVSGWAMHLAGYVSAVHEQYYNSTNVWGSCIGRSRPDWLNSTGTYYGLPYDWGGWDTTGQFADKMAQGYQAGDDNSGGSYACSRGVDCSGLISVAWYLPHKYGTWTLHQVSHPHNWFMAIGDILNKPGTHVVMFLEYHMNGIGSVEATTGSYDRVVVRARSWSSLSGYQQRRYNNYCGHY